MKVLANDAVTTLSDSLEDADALWIASDELGKTIGFELKPEGACQGGLCVPIRQDEDNELFKIADGKKWVNASLLATKLDQPFLSDAESEVWSFGAGGESGVDFFASLNDLLERFRLVLALEQLVGSRPIVVKATFGSQVL